MVAYGVGLIGLIVSACLYLHVASKYLFVRILRNSVHLQTNTVVHWAVWLYVALNLRQRIRANKTPVDPALAVLVPSHSSSPRLFPSSTSSSLLLALSALHRLQSSSQVGSGCTIMRNIEQEAFFKRLLITFIGLWFCWVFSCLLEAPTELCSWLLTRMPMERLVSQPAQRKKCRLLILDRFCIRLWRQLWLFLNLIPDVMDMTYNLLWSWDF